MKSTNRILGTLVMTLAIGFIGDTLLCADATIFLSSSTTLDGTAEANANPTFTLVPGGSDSVGIFVKLSGAEAINGMDLSLVETSGLLTASSVNIVENDNADPPAGFKRWNQILTPTLNASANELITKHNTIGGLAGYAGLAGGFMANFDQNYSASEGLFLLSTFDITAGDATGTTDLHLQVGGQRIGYAPGNTTDVTFGLGQVASDRTVDGATDSVADATVSVIPEPATLTLLGLAGLVGLRRRR